MTKDTELGRFEIYSSPHAILLPWKYETKAKAHQRHSFAGYLKAQVKEVETIWIGEIDTHNFTVSASSKEETIELIDQELQRLSYLLMNKG